jgi:hypothetical protein
MTTVAQLTPEQQADLYAQVGDVMNSPGFNYDAHISANTVNGVFNRPVHIPTSTNDPQTQPVTGGGSNAPVGSGSTSTISNLSEEELADLYSQVGDAMFAPAFNYLAHIAGNTVNGVFTPPVYIPSNTSSLLSLPGINSAAYQQLLIETGGASANPGFNYAAHLAATVSQSRFDLSYDDVIRIIAESGNTNFSNFDLAAYRSTTGSTVGLGNNFANITAASVAANQIQQAVNLQMPEPGSAEYRALSEETGGASESPGFNYAAHVAAITSQTILTSLSYAEVMTLIAETGRSNFIDFDLIAHQQEKLSVNTLIDRLAINPIDSSSTIPDVGSEAYQTILADTGLGDLSNFDYGAYLAAKREAQLALSTLYGSSQDDVIVITEVEGKSIVVTGAGDDVVTASVLDDILIGGAGFDELDGGVGLDRAVFTGALSDYQISKSTEEISITDNQVTRDGSDSLRNVERLSFSDSALAFDIDPNQTAGSVYMLYQATFNRTPDAEGIGYWISQVDNGADITQDVAAFFTTSDEFVTKYGANPTNASYVDNLYLNVLGRSGESGGVAYWNQELNAGRVTKAYVLEQFATLAEGAQLVAPAIANGIAYQEWVE